MLTKYQNYNSEIFWKNLDAMNFEQVFASSDVNSSWGVLKNIL